MAKIITSDLSLTSNETIHLVDRLALALMHLDIKPDSILALHVDLSLNSVALMMAVIKLGLKVALCPAREPVGVLNAWLKDLGAANLILIGDHSLKSQFSIPVRDLNQLLEKVYDAELLEDRSQEFLSYLRTSGTTNTPKTAVISYAAHHASALSVNAYFNFDEHKAWALSLPLYHVSGLSIIFRALAANAHIYVAKNHQELVSALTAKRLSHCSVVPSQVRRLLLEDVDVSGLLALIVGGDSLRPQDCDQALKRGWPLYESYGLCETASMVAVKKSCEAHAKMTMLSHAHIRFDESQEIFVKATSFLSGYFHEGTLSSCLGPDGYFATGDMSMVGDISHLNIICRKNNRIISGGENIQAEEVESLLEQHPLIEECVIVATFDEAMGARPLAFIKWREEALPAEQIHQFLAARCASYKRPKAYISYPLHMPPSLKKPRRWLHEYSSQLQF